MKKQFRIAILAGPEQISILLRTARLSFGNSNVIASMNPGDLLAISTQLNPTTLILDPNLLSFYNISVDDILALKARFHFHIICISSEEPDNESQQLIDKINPEKTFVSPQEYLTLMEEIPKLSTNSYVKRKKPIQTQTANHIDQIFRECGFHCDVKGYNYIKEALFMLLFQPELQRRGGGSFIFKTLAEKHGDSSRIVSRSIIRFLELSLTPQVEKSFRETLGIPNQIQIFPISFLHFAGIFTAYYCQKFGDPIKLLKYPKKR